MRRHEQPADPAESVAGAICLHLNITVPPDLGREAFMLSKGVTLDVTGHRVRELPPTNVGEVLSRGAREGSGEFLIDATGRQAERRPDSRAALLHGLGFARLVRANALDSPDRRIACRS